MSSFAPKDFTAAEPADRAEAAEHATEHAVHAPFAWTRHELMALALALAVLGVLVGATALFGFAGLISVLLLMVAASVAALIWISRG